MLAIQFGEKRVVVATRVPFMRPDWWQICLVDVLVTVLSSVANTAC